MSLVGSVRHRMVPEPDAQVVQRRLATIAAWDSLQRVMDPARPILSGPEVAESLGVHCRDYVRVRDGLTAILYAAVGEYWNWLGITYRVVRRFERNPER